MKEHKYCKYCPYYAYNIVISGSKEDGCLGCVGNVCQYSGDKCPTCCYEPLENEDNLCEVKHANIRS